jgi:profilin
MSWQEYIDKNLMGSGELKHACIADHEGNLLATSPGFKISPHEVRAITKLLSTGDQVISTSMIIEGALYLTLRVDGNVFYGRKNLTTCVCIKTKQLLVIGTNNDHVQPGRAANIIGRFADELGPRGF